MRKATPRTYRFASPTFVPFTRHQLPLPTYLIMDTVAASLLYLPRTIACLYTFPDAHTHPTILPAYLPLAGMRGRPYERRPQHRLSGW